MIDDGRQVPGPAALAWLVDLTHIDGPRFIVLRLVEPDARAALAAHLVDIGSISNTIDAERVVAAAPAHPVGVIW